MMGGGVDGGWVAVLPSSSWSFSASALISASVSASARAERALVEKNRETERNRETENRETERLTESKWNPNPVNVHSSGERGNHARPSIHPARHHSAYSNYWPFRGIMATFSDLSMIPTLCSPGRFCVFWPGFSS